LKAVAAAVFVLAIVGAVPQYWSWFNTYVRGVPSAEDDLIGTWEVNASSDRGPLQIVSVSRQGELRGTLTKHLLDKLATPGMPVELLCKAVRVAVQRETNGRQTPWESSSLTGDVYFIDPPRPQQVVLWDTVMAGNVKSVGSVLFSVKAEGDGLHHQSPRHSNPAYPFLPQ
jgi:hypothetical protein